MALAGQQPWGGNGGHLPRQHARHKNACAQRRWERRHGAWEPTQTEGAGNMPDPPPRAPVLLRGHRDTSRADEVTPMGSGVVQPPQESRAQTMDQGTARHMQKSGGPFGPIPFAPGNARQEGFPHSARSWDLRPKVPAKRTERSPYYSSAPGIKEAKHRDHRTMALPDRVADETGAPRSPVRNQQAHPPRDGEQSAPALRANGQSGNVDLESSPDTERLLHREPAASIAVRRKRRWPKRSRSRQKNREY
jgi:hypothetical protein